MEAYKTLRDNRGSNAAVGDMMAEIEQKCRNIKRFIDARS